MIYKNLIYLTYRIIDLISTKSNENFLKNKPKKIYENLIDNEFNNIFGRSSLEFPLENSNILDLFSKNFFGIFLSYLIFTSSGNKQ